MPSFDALGIGLNATDTLVLVPHFPAYAGKVRLERELISPGGQVASAMVACAKLGLRSSYIGTVGDDERGRIQLESLRAAGVEMSSVEVYSNCATQTAYILVDQATGERTVIWRRDDCLALPADQITEAKISETRLLHIDAHDMPAIAKAASIARRLGIPVTLDVDTIHPGVETVLPHVDYLIASTEFPLQWTGDRDPFRALELMQGEYGMHVAAMTLGPHGALARCQSRFYYSPGFVVNCVDTTGAGDVFHGAFCYAVIEKMPLLDSLEFANAMAALNCTALGARGGIATLPEVLAFRNRGERRSNPDFEQRV